MTVARPADIEELRRSWPDTCAISCPSTPRSFGLVQRTEQALGAADRGGARAAADGEGVRLLGRRQVTAAAPAAARPCSAPHQPVELGMLHLADRAGQHGGQGHPVAAGDDGDDEHRREHDRDDGAAPCGRGHPEQGAARDPAAPRMSLARRRR